MRRFYRFTLTYNLPQLRVQPHAVSMPQGAEVVLESALP